MDVKSLIHTEPLKDKSLWLAVAAPIIVILGKVVGLDLNAETIMALLSPIVMSIGASKVKQAMVAKEVVATGLLESLAKIQQQLAEKPAQEEKKNE